MGSSNKRRKSNHLVNDCSIISGVDHKNSGFYIKQIEGFARLRPVFPMTERYAGEIQIKRAFIANLTNIRGFATKGDPTDLTKNSHCVIRDRNPILNLETMGHMLDNENFERDEFAKGCSFPDTRSTN